MCNRIAIENIIQSRIPRNWKEFSDSSYNYVIGIKVLARIIVKCLLSVVGKMFGRNPIDCVQKITYNMIVEEQYGFRPGRNT